MNKINVFGRLMLAMKSADGWSIFYQEGDGKRRRENDVIVPSFVTEPEIENYLADLCHEWATAKYPEVRRLD